MQFLNSIKLLADVFALCLVLILYHVKLFPETKRRVLTKWSMSGTNFVPREIISRNEKTCFDKVVCIHSQLYSIYNTPVTIGNADTFVL
jgi:hypothetical protein